MQGFCLSRHFLWQVQSMCTLALSVLVAVPGLMLTPQVRLLQVLRDTRALMLNGFVLDELPGPLVVAAALQTRAAGGSVFFDPGTRLELVQRLHTIGHQLPLCDHRG